MHQECIKKSNEIKDPSPPFEIIPYNSFNKNLASYSININNSIKILLISLLSSETIELARNANNSRKQSDIDTFIKAFDTTLPFSKFNISESQDEANVAFTTICSAHNTQGTGRHISEICSHWLVPGKQIPLTYVFSYVFSFSFLPQKKYLIHQINANLLDKEDAAILTKTLPVIDKEIKISISAVQYAREVVSIDSYEKEEKKELVYQNLKSLIKQTDLKPSESVFNHIHHLFIKLCVEKKNSHISQQIAPLLASNSRIFQRDIFTDLQNFLIQFQTNFVFKRRTEYLSKLVSLIYLFKKNMAEQIITRPKERHLNLKVLTSTYESDKNNPFLGLLICVNILKPNEVIAKEHIEKALKTTLNTPFGIHFFESIDKTNHSMRILYFEIMKYDHSIFNQEELDELRSQLAKSIKVHIKRTINPVFMAKNEEEILKNVITLSKQLKYVHDIPQMMINFHKQTDEDLIFTIIILRIKKAKSYSMKRSLEDCSNRVAIENIKEKLVGYLRKKHQKQACIFDVRLSKKQFLQQDSSVDLYEARSCIYEELSRNLGELRDFNGGMFFKQHEVFAELKNQTFLTKNTDDFTLKSFFYNITPPHMQGVLEVNTIKSAFNLLISHPNLLEKELCSLHYYQYEKYFILLLNSTSNISTGALIKTILQLNNCPHLEARSHHNTPRGVQTIFIFRCNIQEKIQQFYQKVTNKLASINELSSPNMNDNILSSKPTTYELFTETKSSPNLMLNEHF